MAFKTFRLGMRTLKSALAVMLCIILFHFYQRGSSMIASIAAVFALRQDLTSSLSFGKSRVIGNSLGGLLAVIYVLIKNAFSQDFLVDVLVMPLMIILVIVISDSINNNMGIISAVATLLMIALSIPQGESVYYAVERVIDTFIGTFIAIGLNLLFVPKPKEAKAELDEDLKILEMKEKELELLREKIQKQLQEK